MKGSDFRVEGRSYQRPGGVESVALIPSSGLDVVVRATRRGEHPKDLAAWMEVFGFARWAGEFIASQGSSFGVRPFHVGQARILGLEMARAVWLDHVEGEVSVTLTDPRDTTPSRLLSNDVLPFRSRFVGSGRLVFFTEPEDNALRLDRASAQFDTVGYPLPGRGVLRSAKRRGLQRSRD